MPPVPKNSDWPNDSSPVKPNRMSKPMPKNPHTTMRLIVVGAKPRRGSMNGAATSPITVRISSTKGRCRDIKQSRSFAVSRSEQPVGSDDQHQGHRHEQHHVGVAGVEHRGD